MVSLKKVVLLAVAALVAVPGIVSAQVKVDPSLPAYKPVSGVSGSLKSIGSDTMNNEMTLWAEGFLKHYPNVKIEIEGKGSSTAPPALIAGTSQFGPMSRRMKDAEVADFEKKFGYKPTPLPTSIDMLAVYVNKDNPIKGISLQQGDAIFSKTRKGGFPTDIRTWGQAGLTGEWASQPISLYGRNSASGIVRRSTAPSVASLEPIQLPELEVGSGLAEPRISVEASRRSVSANNQSGLTVPGGTGSSPVNSSVPSVRRGAGICSSACRRVFSALSFSPC